MSNSTVKQLLDSLLWDIYGRQQLVVESPIDYRHNSKLKRKKKSRNISKMARSFLGLSYDSNNILQKLSVRQLIDICAILKVELRLMGYILERVLIERDRHRRHQEVLCGFVDAMLQLECHDAHPKMRFSLSPPPTKAASATTSPTMQSQLKTSAKSDEEKTEMADDAASDYKQWLHAMKLVARLPGGMPPEFRRKLWLSLADKYLKSKNLDWSKEEEKCFCEKWREDDEELGIQIVKDLHRTGSNLCTGPAGTINQAKLKRILLGYARYNPEVGYCQGFNMLGALILQVMDKEESESMKVMIYLVEGVLPPGYFCGSMGGLQADMGVFRELMTSKLPRLAKHLQKLQGPIENAYEPPLTNVFTMQWFLTMFCTCLPMTCVLRVWDLVLIEGSDVLLRTALVLWSLLEERILSARTADDFYCKMGSFSSELLNGHLIDSNGLIEKVVQLGPIADIQRLRDKHLYNIAPLSHKPGLQLYYDDEEPESDEESRLAVATVWGLPWGRRGSAGQAASSKPVPLENKDRIALDISLLKKQYDRLRERQKQAHIILTTACTTAARQGSTSSIANPSLPVNNLLLGRSAIVTNRGKRIGAPTGSIPPARKPSLPAILQTSSRPQEKQLRRGETLHWRDTDLTKRRKDSLTWKEIKADRSLSRDNSENIQPCKLRTRIGKSDSSSYSEESDDTEGSSTDTSLCDEEDAATSSVKTAHGSSSKENSPKKRSKSSRKQKELTSKLRQSAEARESSSDRKRPKSWAPSNDEIPFVLMTSESPQHSGDEKQVQRQIYEEMTMKEDEDSATESDRLGYKFPDDLDWTGTKYSPIAGDLATSNIAPLHVQTDVLELPMITSLSQLSPLPDISQYLASSTISPMPTPKPLFLDSINSLGSGDGEEPNKFDVSDDGVTNEYFERVNSVERPNKLDLFYSLSEEDSVRNAYVSNDEDSIADSEKHKSELISNKSLDREEIEGCEAEQTVLEEEVEEAHSIKHKFQDQIRMELLDDYSEKSSVAFIAEATNEVSTSYTKQKEHDLSNHERLTRSFDAGCSDLFDIKNENRRNFQRKYSQSEASKKRRDLRRLTISQPYMVETADNYQRLSAHFKDEKSEKGNQNVKAGDVASSCLGDFSQKDKKTVIPSTADLEDRFNRLELEQLIEGKINTDTQSFKLSPEKSQAGENISKRNDIALKLEQHSIPSIDDVEERFSALEEKKQKPGSKIESEIVKDSNDKEEVERGTVKPEAFNDVDNDRKNVDNEEPKEIVLQTDKCVQDDKESSSSRFSPSHALSDTIKENKKILEDSQHNSMSLDSYQKTSSDLKHNGIKLKEDEKLQQSYQSLAIKTEFHENLTDFSYGKSLEKQIPSIEELENRFSALEKQLSSHSNSSKDYIDINKHSKESESEKHAKKPKNNNKTSPENVDAKGDTQTKPESSTKSDQPESDSNPRLSKIPSTAELEDRFNAMERKMSVSNKSPSKSKKEPPDDTKHNKETSDKDKGTDKDKETTRKEEEEEESKERKVTKDANANTKEKPETKDVKNEDKIPPISSKSPPTTEELDRRFEAIEKSLSSTNNTLNKNKTQVKEFLEDTQESAESTQKLQDKLKEVNKQMIQTKESKQELIEKQDHAINEDSEIVSITKEHEIKSFQDKSELINDTLGQETEKVSKTFRSQIELSSKNAQVELPNTSKRRASEPPTTEDLETRYEALKRRMSTKTFSETRNVSERKKTLMRSETVEEALERIEKEVIDEPTEVHQEEKIPNTEEENKQADKVSPESLTLIQTKEIVKRRASEPPTTEALEKRYEKLKRKMSSTVECSYEHGEVDANIEKKVQVQTTTDDDQSQDAPNKTETERNSNVHVQPTIPSPPPMQANHKPPSIPPKALNHRRALVRELQSKMIPNDENLKPSDVNPNRKTSPSKHQHATMADETSEAHATTASIRLKNCEPWHMQPQKMVRRFSDLPSRSDLENRVHFLEEQLKLKYVKQRSASDSDVASRTHFVGLKDDSAHASSTSSAQAIRQESDLESRVKALEKQLSENSLKLIEAMRQKPKERDEHIVEAHVSTMGPKSDGVHPNIRTGMELVRYAHSELELENAETVKPINISINIKMHINKDSEEKRKHIASPKAEVLEKRLEALEQKVTKSQQAQFSTEKNIGEAEVHVQVKTPSTETSEKRENEPNAEIVRTQIMVEKPDSKDSTNSSAIQKSEPENDTEFQSKETKDKPKTTAATSQKQEIISNSKKDAPVSEPTKEKKSEPNAAESKVTNKESTHAEIVSVVTGEEKEETVEVTEEEKAKEPANTISENIERKNETSLKAPTVDQNEPNNKNMALPLDTEPRGNKIRRLTRANTEELEGLLQALEIQLSNRNLIKSEEGKLVRADSVPKTNAAPSTRSQEQSEALVDLSKEIQEFASNNKHDKADKTEKSEQTETSEKSEKTAKTESTQEAQQIQKSEKDEYDWGPDPVKRHLKRSTVYLPSTRELEARYRSLERQIKLLEDVEKIDVEQRLNEIERKIKLQYSLSHEKDLSKYLELCEGKLPDDEIPGTTTPSKSPKGSRPTTPHTSPGRVRIKTPHTSPTRIQEKTSYTSPSRSRDRSPYTSPSPSRSSKRTSYASPGCHKQGEERATTIDDLECRYRVLELEKYKPKEKRNGKSKKKSALKKQPIHPLEMLLDPSPDENDIPTTGELEHRIRVLDGKCQTPSPPRNSRNRSSSPTVEDIKREKLLDERRPKTPIHSLETMVTSPTKKDLPTEEELEARMRALEQDQKFDFKMQKNYKEFNQKLKDVISPSLSFEEFKATKSREQSPRRGVTKSVLKDHDIDYNHEEITCRSTSPKMIRFRDDEEEHKPRSLKDFHIDHHDHQDTVKMVGNCESVLTIIEENSKMLHHILKKTLADSNSSSINECGASAKGLDVHGPRLMRETSPLRRTGTHTGIPLRTDDNINDRLNSIKNTIKSIDTLCEEKPYHKEKCQRYIDSLFTESVYFASPSKKSSLEDLSYKRRSGEYAPSIRISDHSLRPSEYLSRSLGSAESIRSMSPSRGASPLHHRSTRELHRDISPRRHRFDEEHEEYESRITTNTNKTQVFKY